MSAAKSLAPELENGAVMTRAEFHAAYLRCTGLRRAELVDGVVYMPSPVRYETHDRQAGLLRGWLFAYTLKHPQVQTGGEATLILGNSEVQPDAFLMHAGSVPIDEDGYLTNAPQLVVEVAASSASRDLHSKFDLYRHAGVREYVVWRSLVNELDWFRNTGDEFVRVEPDAAGIIESANFEGLRLHLPSLLGFEATALVSHLA